jgi:hypothetical protein
MVHRLKVSGRTTFTARLQGFDSPCLDGDVSSKLFSVSSRTIVKDLAGRGSYSVPPHLATAARQQV